MGVGVPTDVKDYAIDSGSLTFATFPDFREISTNLISLKQDCQANTQHGDLSCIGQHSRLFCIFYLGCTT